MDLGRRDFTRVGGCWLASLVARPLFAQTECQAESPTAPRVVRSWGTNGRAQGQFDVPIAIVITKKDEILVTDFHQSNVEANGRLQRFDTDGRFLGSFEVEPMPGRGRRQRNRVLSRVVSGRETWRRLVARGGLGRRQVGHQQSQAATAFGACTGEDLGESCRAFVDDFERQASELVLGIVKALSVERIQ